MISKRPLRLLTAVTLLSLVACGSAEDHADPTIAPPPGSVSIPPSPAPFTGAYLCAVLTGADKQALGLAGPGKPWDRPYKMGGSRRSRCAWSDSAAEVDIAFHDGAAKDIAFSTDAEVSKEQIDGRDARVVVFGHAPDDCLVAVALSAATHLQITSTPPSEDEDAEESCAFAKRVAQVAISRISR